MSTTSASNNPPGVDGADAVTASDDGVVEKKTIAIADDAGREYLIGTRFTGLCEAVVIGVWRRSAERYQMFCVFWFAYFGWTLVEWREAWADELTTSPLTANEWVKRAPEFKELFEPLGILGLVQLRVTHSLASLRSSLAIGLRAVGQVVARVTNNQRARKMLEAADTFEPERKGG